MRFAGSVQNLDKSRDLIRVLVLLVFVQVHLMRPKA